METAKAIAAFITSCRARNLRPKSIQGYTWALRYIADQEQLPTEPFEIELVLAEAAAHLGPESHFDLWQRLRTFFRWIATRYEQTNPFERPSPGGRPVILVQPPMRPPRLPKLLSAEQIQALLDRGCRTHRDRLMVWAILETGLRFGEVASLTKDCIGAEVLRVQGKRGMREVAVSPSLSRELLLEGNATHVWVNRDGQPLTPAGIKIAYRRIFARAGVKAGPHALRHTFATRYLKRLGNSQLFYLQRQLGHRDIKTTERYVWLVHDDLVAAHRQANPAPEFILPQRRLL